LLRWTLVLFVLAIPFEAWDLGLGSASTARIAALPFFLVCLLVPKKSFRAPTAAVWCFLIYLGVVAVGAIYTPPSFRDQAMGAFTTIFQLVAFFWVASNLFRDPTTARRAMGSYALGTMALAMGVLFALPGLTETLRARQADGSHRVTAFDYNPNDLAALGSVGAVIVIGAFINSTKVRNRLFLAAAAVPLVLLINRTGSRSGVVAMLAGLAVFVLPAKGARRRFGVAVLAGAVLLGAVALVMTDSLMQARLTETVEEGDAVRDRIYSTALDAIADRPIVGWGPGYGLRELGRRLNSPAGVRDAHNLVLYLLLEVGVAGTIPALLGLWLVFRAAWKGRFGPLGVAPLALVVTVLTAGLTHTFITRKPMWLALALGLASGANVGVRMRALPGPRPVNVRAVRSRIEATGAEAE
jgi:O-antigen ligase